MGKQKESVIEIISPTIKKIQSYYGWIIYKCKGDAKKMQKQILAMCNHLGSSDENPKHFDCDPDSCGYLKAEAEGDATKYKHKGDKHFHLPEYITNEIYPVFEKMSNLDLLEKCEHGKTQNANECANSTVWNLLSKNGFANRDLLELVTSMATCMYNEGKIAVLDVLSSLGVPVGTEMVVRCRRMDNLRIKKACQEEKTWQESQQEKTDHRR